MYLVALAVRLPLLPLPWLFGASHVATVFNLGPQKSNGWAVDGSRHGSVLCLKKKFRFSALCVCHNDTSLLVNNTALSCHEFALMAKQRLLLKALP